MQVKRRTIVLQGNTITSIEALYDQIGRQLPLPPYFGRNLDALWDLLSTDIPGPLTLIWKNSSHSQSAMGNDFLRVKKLFEELARERKDFTLKFEP